MMSLHFLVSFSTSFFRYLEFSLQQSFTSLIRFMPRNFIFFDNENVSVISCSVLLYQCAEKLLILVN